MSDTVSADEYWAKIIEAIQGGAVTRVQFQFQPRLGALLQDGLMATATASALVGPAR